MEAKFVVNPVPIQAELDSRRIQALARVYALLAELGTKMRERQEQARGGEVDDRYGLTTVREGVDERG